MENEENVGMHLLKKGKKGLIRIVFSRLGLILVLFVIQVFFLLCAFWWFGEFLPHIMGSTVLFTAIMVIYLFNCDFESDVKLTWLIVIMLLPVFGAIFLLYTRMDIGHRAIKARLQQLIGETKECLPQSDKTLQELAAENPESTALAHYIGRTGCYPVYQNTEVDYFPLGEDKFQELLIQLEQAEHFIFLEYFIIEEGVMWGKILEILAKKAAEGVEVRVLYDGTCEFSTLPHDYPRRLRKLGIQCKMFAPLTPFVSTHYNYRDHRKILVIDGHTAFNGGVNLADEYINHVEKYGHWKDTAVMLKGEAVASFTLMFLQMWNLDEKVPEFDKYIHFPVEKRQEAKGYVLPFGDYPLDRDKVGERVYMDILNQSRRYVHIMTPYLILDGEMQAALQFAAERGIDVRIILPGIPDKRIPYALAKTHYDALLKSGVKIYEYTPGFVHAKVFVSDDIKAVVGTINLDYRSLYHHFECATYMCHTKCISDIEEDFWQTLDQCTEITMETVLKQGWGMRLTGCIAKALAPLL
ncbi:MAG: cardiolipin synthase [Lachnospiraceae bacterium]|nr:cardiolipin synthase [Lachnospiraceae bacterium]